MAYVKPRGVSKTLYGQRRLRIGETMGGGGGMGSKGKSSKADNQTKDAYTRSRIQKELEDTGTSPKDAARISHKIMKNTDKLKIFKKGKN